MPVRYFNWRLAVVLVISLLVLGVGAFGLRRWHKSNRTQQGLVQGTEAYGEGRWEEAAEYLGRYLAVRRDDVAVLLKYADAQLKIRPTKRNHVQQALGAYRTILRVDRNNSEAVKKLVEIYLQIGPGEAELILRRQLETNPNPELRRMLALALAAQRKFHEAATELETVLQEHPEQILAYETLGQLVERRPRDFEVMPIHWFDKAVENSPSSALAHIIRAAFYRRNDDVPRALADLEQAENQDLSDADVRLRLAEEFINCGDLARAEEHLTAVQEVMTTDQGLWRAWAQYALKVQSPEKMLAVAEDGLKALALQPWDFMPIAADLYIRCGELDDANDCISKLNEQSVSPAAVAYLRGCVAARQGRLREAVRRWRQSVESGNKSPQVRLALASTLSRLGDVQTAVRLVRTLISENPDSSEAHLALARLSAQLGNWVETAAYARRASELGPDNPESAQLHLQAQIRLLAGSPPDPAGARAQRVQAIEAELSALKQASGGAGDVDLLEFEFALRRGKLAEAETFASRLKETRLSPERIALAEIQLLTAQNRVDEAIERLDDAIEQFPESLDLVRYLAILSDQEGLREKCEETLKRAMARTEEPVSHRELGLLLARFYTRWGQDGNACAMLLALSQKLPDDIPVKRQLLLCEQIAKDPERAQQLVDEVKAREGEKGWQWRYEQAKLWFAGEHFENRHPEIVSLLQENMLANPDDQASRMLLGRCYERAGDLQLAISTYREALRMAPDDIRIIVPTIAALYSAREYDEAQEIMARASQRKLHHPELRKWQFQLHLRHGELDSASGILQELVNDDPNNQAACLSLALLKIQQDELDDASELLVRLKSQDPNSVPVAAAQIQLNIRRDRPAEALRLSNEVIRSLNNASAYTLRARTFASLGQTDKAVEDMERAAALDPNGMQVWVAKSDLYRSMGQMEKAAADIRQALSLAPDNVYVQRRAISLLLASAEPAKVREGEALLEKALSSNAGDIELRLLKARALLAGGTDAQIDEAVQILENVTEDQPEVGEAWVLKGEIAIRRGQSVRAMDAALSGLTYRPNDRALLLLKARAEAGRSPVLAVPTLKGLHELDPNDSGVALLLANTYIEASEPEKAVALMTEQLTRCDVSSVRPCRMALAVALYKTGDKGNAFKELDLLLASEPDDPSPLLAQVRLLTDDEVWSELARRVNDWYDRHPQDSPTAVAVATDLLASADGQAKKTAEAILQTVLNKDPDCVDAMDVLAVLLLQTPGRAAESAELYRRILQLRPDHIIAMNNLAWILSEEQGKHQEALELTQKGLTIAPEYADLLDTRGVVYYRLGEYEKAVRDFTECIRLYSNTAPAGAGARFHLARAYAKLAEQDKAIEQLSQALTLQSRIGGLSPADLEEARRLQKQLQEGR